MIRLLLVTQIELIGNVVAAMLEDESDMDVVGCVTSVEEALAKAAESARRLHAAGGYLPSHTC